METPEEIQANVERGFDLELAALRALDAASERLLDLLPSRGLQNEGDRILAMAIARGTTTFKGALCLIENGFGREALMLTRSLFEGAAVAYWISSNPDKAAEHFALSNEHEIHLMGQKLDELGIADPLSPSMGRLDDEKLAKARKLFGKDNQRLWTGHRTIWDLIREVEGRLEKAGRLTLLDYMKHDHGRNTKEMHATASAIFGIAINPAAVGPDGHRGISVRVGPGPDSLDEAAQGAFLNHSNLLLLLVDHFKLGPEAQAELDQAITDNAFAFAVIDPVEARKLSRNDLCLCGSGKKFKNCHWDRMRHSL